VRAGVVATEILVVMLPKHETGFECASLAGSRCAQRPHSALRFLGPQLLASDPQHGDVPLEEVPSWKFWHHPKKLKSTAWLLEVMTRPEVADTRPVFLIHHSELLGELSSRTRASRIRPALLHFNQLKPVFNEIAEQGRKASALKPEEQTSFHKQVVKLSNALMLYQRLKVSLQPEGMDHFDAVLADFEKNLGPPKRRPTPAKAPVISIVRRCARSLCPRSSSSDGANTPTLSCRRSSRSPDRMDGKRRCGAGGFIPHGGGTSAMKQLAAISAAYRTKKRRSLTARWQVQKLVGASLCRGTPEGPSGVLLQRRKGVFACHHHLYCGVVWPAARC